MKTKPLSMNSNQTMRTPGRPIARDQQGVLREQLLDNAVLLFAEQGVAGTSLHNIARKTAVTPAMLHYYFKNREALLDAIAEERLKPIVQSVWQTVEGNGDDLNSVIGSIVHQLLIVAQHNPAFPSLWAREIVHAKGAFRERLFHFLPVEKMDRFASLVRSGQQSGLIHPAIQPRLLFLSLIGLTFLPMATAGVWNRFAELIDITVDDLANHAIALLQCGLGMPNNVDSKKISDDNQVVKRTNRRTGKT